MTSNMYAPLEKHHDLALVPEAMRGTDWGADGVSVDGQLHRNVRLLEFENHLYVVSHKAILTISLTPVCNASCTFCFNGITFFPGHRALDPSHEDVIRALDFARAGGVHSVSFSGGEPTLVPENLLSLVSMCTPEFPGFRRLHTNGSRLWKTIEHRGRKTHLWRHLADAGLTEISLSRASMDVAANSRIMRMPEKDTMTREELRELATSFPLVRLSCFVHPEGVSSPDEAVDYVAAGMAFGVRSFVFRISSRYPQTPVLPSEFSAGNSVLPLKTEEFCSVFQRLGFELIFSRHDVDYDLYIVQLGAVTVSIDSSADVPDPDRKIRRLLLMPNRICYTSWVEGSSSLFPGDHWKLAQQTSDDVTLGKRFPAHSVRRLYVKRADPVEIDLHMHSLLSDGVLPPSAIIDRQVEAGAKVIVLTEHNAVHPRFERMRELAGARGIRLPFPGAEVSCRYSDPQGGYDYRFHVLVYGDGLLNLAFQTWIAQANEPEREAYLGLHARLRAGGLDLPDFAALYSMEDPETDLSAPRGQYQRTPLAAAVARSLDISLDEAKAKYVPKVSFEEKQASAIGVIDLIRRADEEGCVCVLAHPGWVRDASSDQRGSFDHLLEVILLLQGHGLQGIEVFHRVHDENTTKRLSNLALGSDLIITGGSDFHGKPNDRLGVHGTTWENLERIEALLEWKLGRVQARESGQLPLIGH